MAYTLLHITDYYKIMINIACLRIESIFFYLDVSKMPEIVRCCH